MKKSLLLTIFVLLGLFALVFGGAPVYADTESAAANSATGSADASAEEERDPAKAKSKTPEFTGEQLALKKFMDELFDDSKKVNEGGATGKKARNTIESAVDWNEVAKICLGGQKAWAAQNMKNRAEFSNLLKDIIALTAYSRMGDFWNGTSYTIKKIDIKGNEAKVLTTFSTSDDDYALEYSLNKSGRNWKLVDLSFDDIKYSDNIREQIQAFLKEKNFAVLLGKLRKRRADLQAEEKNKKKAANAQRSS